jgi:hypothetical protein
MSKASVAAAKIYVAMSIPNSEFDQLFCSNTPEPYRAVIDLGRDLNFHDVVDGSEDYEHLVDCLEMLICD